MQLAFAIFIQATFWFISYKNVSLLRSNILTRLVDSMVVYITVIIFTATILSLFKAFDRQGIIISLCIYITLTIINNIRIKKTKAKKQKKFASIDGYLLLLAIICTGTVIYRAYGILDMTPDSVTFVLPRIHLFEQLHSFLFDSYTNIINIWCNQMNFEILATTWNILTQSDYFASLANQTFYFLSIISSYLLLAKLGISKKFALFGGLVIALLPLNFLIAHTVKSDSALFASMITTLLYYCRFWKNNKLLDLSYFFVTAAITIGIKITALPFIGLLSVSVLVFKKTEFISFFRHNKKVFIYTIIIAGTVGLHRYIANWVHYGNPLIRVPGEELILDPTIIINSIIQSIGAQFSYLLNSPLPITKMESVLGANGGYAFIPILLLATSGLFLQKKWATLSQLTIIITIIHTLLLIITREWYPWSTRYFAIIFFIFTWIALEVLTVLYIKQKKIAVIISTVCLILLCFQTVQILIYDDSNWLKNSLSKINIITRYDALQTYRKIRENSKILFIAHPDTPIYQYITPHNEILFSDPMSVPKLTELMRNEKISYVITTNQNKKLTSELMNTKEFKTLKVRIEEKDPNITNVFEISNI